MSGTVSKGLRRLVRSIYSMEENEPDSVEHHSPKRRRKNDSVVYKRHKSAEDILSTPTTKVEAGSRSIPQTRRKRNRVDHNANEGEGEETQRQMDARKKTGVTKHVSMKRARRQRNYTDNTSNAGDHAKTLVSESRMNITPTHRIGSYAKNIEGSEQDMSSGKEEGSEEFKYILSPLQNSGNWRRQSGNKLENQVNLVDGSSTLARKKRNVTQNKVTASSIDSFNLSPKTDVGRQIKKILRARLTCKRSTKLIGIDAEYQKVFRLIEQTVSAGEGNSALLIGARGSGKSAIICKALDEVSRQYDQEFYIVRLNGFFLTDDRLALREIWRQLGREMDVEDETSGKNYADALSKLLALLSHSDEPADHGSNAALKSVIFVMEEFDQFASHPRQTLLYNLFDIAQSRKAPIAVIGTTTRIDIADSMEKRVKSRFSHRYIHIPLAKDLTTFREICRANLECTSENLNAYELLHLSKMKKTSSGRKKKEQGSNSNFLNEWNASVTTLLEDLDTERFLKHKFDTSKSTAEAILALSSSLFDRITPPLPIRDFTTIANNNTDNGPLYLNVYDPPESKLIILPYLPTVALSLLIAAARLDIVLDTDTVNFNMVYDEYSSLAGKARIASAAGGAVTAGASTKVWSRNVAIKEWDRLVAYGLLLPLQGTVAPFGMYRVDIALEEIVPSVPGLDRTLEKWCRQI